jgi:hypothetical protein
MTKSSTHFVVSLLKPGQNKKGQKNFQLHRFLNTFLQLSAEKKYSKNGAAGKIFGPSYFVTALATKKGFVFKFLPSQKT